jgi:aspartate aminotransferase
MSPAVLSQRVQAVEESLTLKLSAKAKAMRAEGRDVVSYTAGELDVGPPEAAMDEVRAALKRGETRYTPAPGTPALRAAIAETATRETGVGYEPGQVIVSCGAKHSLFNCVQALADPGDEVLIPTPFWLSYEAMARLAGAAPVFVRSGPEHRHKLTPEALAAAITPRSKVLLLNTPSNPTGAVYTTEELHAVAEVLRAHPRIVIITDEIYGKLTYGDAQHISPLRVAPDLADRTVLVDGVSKSYAMTGFRIGWAVGPPGIVAACNRLQSHSTSCPSSLSQAAALAAIRTGDAPIRPVRSLLEDRRRMMIDGIGRIPGFSLVPPDGAFYCFPSVAPWIGQTVAGAEIRSALDLCEVILEQAEVALVPGDPFGAPDHVRFSFALATEDLVRGLERLATFLTPHAPSAVAAPGAAT